MPRSVKRLILLAVDLLLVAFSLYYAFALRFGELLPIERIVESLPVFAAVLLASLPVFAITRLHRIKLIAFEMQDIKRGAIAALSLMILSFALILLARLPGYLSIPLIFGPVYLISHIIARILARSVLLRLSGRNRGRIPVAIYGAGSAGVQLAAALRQDFEMRPVVFVDDNLTLQAMTVSGLQVVSRGTLEQMVTKGTVSRVLLAMPSLSEAVRRRRVEELSDLGCEVHALPSYTEMVDGSGLAENLSLVTPDMLLGRDKVDLEIPEVAKAYAGRNVLVTGAGGSIGSELCRQVLRCGPHRIVMLDHSEFALYRIDKELRSVAERLGVYIESKLGSVCDRDRMDAVLAEAEIDIVLHAAAYKHVPLVESNELEGVRNNVLGTQVIADAARAADVERFILISTDKAVRPTSIMGGTKRLAELVIQDLQTRAKGTKFSMVRFGNVLGSSGSVIPLFQEQIAAGGPITVTHDSVTRFFMNIPEASRLVLLAGAHATGGDVFVLDMGKPVNIRKLARRLIELTGLTVRDTENPTGDIEIKTVGLRPGEKLHEELFIGDNLLPTRHEKILRAQESYLSEIEMAKVIKLLRSALDASDPLAAREVIQDTVEGYSAVAPPAAELL